MVRLLGPVEVIDGSDALRSIDSAPRRTLLALLALRYGEVLSPLRMARGSAMDRYQLIEDALAALQ